VTLYLDFPPGDPAPLVPEPSVTSGATFSPCRRYRYSLWRTWYELTDPLVVIGLNPSTADETTNDPTIERCQRRAKQLGLGGLVMLNLFAWRSTDPAGLRETPDPVQEPGTIVNDRALLDWTARGLVLCGWGNHGWIDGRGAIVRGGLIEAGRSLHYLKLNSTGQPQHPLYVSYKVKPIRWEATR
jgi:hypothetical protein